MTEAPIRFIDLGAQRAGLGADLDEAILAVVHHGAYVMGQRCDSSRLSSSATAALLMPSPAPPEPTHFLYR